MSKILIDTSLYVDLIRTGRHHELLKALYTFRTPDIFFSSVVIEELLQGTLDARGRNYVEILYTPFEKASRIVTPMHEDWKETGRILSKIKQRSLLNDCLIALSARRIGAILYCANVRDFELIASVRSFQYQAVE